MLNAISTTPAYKHPCWLSNPCIEKEINCPLGHSVTDSLGITRDQTYQRSKIEPMTDGSPGSLCHNQERLEFWVYRVKHGDPKKQITKQTHNFPLRTWAVHYYCVCAMIAGFTCWISRCDNWQCSCLHITLSWLWRWHLSSWHLWQRFTFSAHTYALIWHSSMRLI